MKIFILNISIFVSIALCEVTIDSNQFRQYNKSFTITTNNLVIINMNTNFIEFYVNCIEYKIRYFNPLDVTNGYYIEKIRYILNKNEGTNYVKRGFVQRQEYNTLKYSNYYLDGDDEQMLYHDDFYITWSIRSTREIWIKFPPGTRYFVTNR